MSEFSVSQEKYEGPLEMVIHLLRKRKLHVSDVNLAQIADEFAEHIKQSDNSMAELSDFVRVMSVLLLIKTKALLPKEPLGTDDEETIAQFEADLLRVELLEEISSNVSGSQGNLISRRERSKAVPTGFIPDPTIKIDQLENLITSITQESRREETFAQVAVTKLANLKTTIESIERRFIALGEADLDQVIPGSMPTAEKVVHFIAVLELLKQNKLSLAEDNSGNKMIQYGSVQTPAYGLQK